MSSRVLEYQPGLFIFVHEFIVAIKPCLKKNKDGKDRSKTSIVEAKNN